MFVDFKDEDWPPPRPEPQPERRRSAPPPLTPRQQSWLARLVLANMLLLLAAPLAGGSIIEGIVALFG